MFAEIEKAYDGRESVFDRISTNDVILAFFPCTRFEAKIPLAFRGELYQMANWNDYQKLEYSIKMHNELHENYVILCKLVLVSIKKNIHLMIENPYTQPHYLTMYWCIKPAIIDKDRSLNGDRGRKPTQYFFIGFEPKNNILFECIDYVDVEIVERIKGSGRKRKVKRSEIHPQYANRFIRQYLLDGQQEDNQDDEITIFDFLKGGE